MAHDDDDAAGLDWVNTRPDGESDESAADADADESDDAAIDADADAEEATPDSEPDDAGAPEGTGDFVWDLKPTGASDPKPSAAVPPLDPEPPQLSEPEPEPELPVPAEHDEPELTMPATGAVLAPDPWWTTPVQSPLVQTAEEAAASELLRMPQPERPIEHEPEAAAPTRPTGPVRREEAQSPPVTPSVVAPMSSVGAVDAHAAAPDRPAQRGTAPRVARILGLVVVGLLAVGVLVALFVLGQRLVAGQAPVAPPVTSATASATPTPTPTPTAEATGPQQAGVHAWDALRGGECVEPYTSPWEEEFTVVACGDPHGGQLVYRGAFDDEADAAFPGEEALAAQINVLCSAPGVIDLAAAEAFSDLQMQGSYPITDEQWTAGQRHYDCFVSRSSDEPLTESLAGPGPAPAD